MSFALTCTSCQATFRVAEKHAGKRGRCPHCRAGVDVPALVPHSPDKPAYVPPPKDPSAPLDLKEVLAAFHGDITPVRSTVVYRIGIVVVTIAMLVLPVLYIALIAAVGFALVWHTVNNISVIGQVRNIWGILLIYVGPIIIGVILLFFMVKPLFAPRSRSARLRTLEFGEEPLLSALVTRVARAVGAPEPKRINVDAQCNATAGFGSTLGGMFGGDLVLTIGLPLVAGMSIEQRAGVIAHELGHFSQGAGMRLSYIVRSINMWFGRIVYERDDWDESLVRGCENGDRLSLILYLAMFCVWITRCILWLLMAVGHGISCFLMRQMEFDADRYETRLVGTATFVSTSRQLLLLSIGTDVAQNITLGSYFHAGRLPDDLSTLVLGIVGDVPRDKVREIEWEVEKSKTGLFDTHPSQGDRVRSARNEKAPGVFHLEGPATRLFKDFRKTSRSVSMDFYRQMFGRTVGRDALVPATTLLKSEEE